MIYSLAASSLSVVHHNNRYRQNNRHLNESIHFIECKEIDNCIHSHIENHPKHLLFEISTICTKCQNTKACYAAPIARKTNKANQYNKYWFYIFFNF